MSFSEALDRKKVYGYLSPSIFYERGIVMRVEETTYRPRMWTCLLFSLLLVSAGFTARGNAAETSTPAPTKDAPASKE